MHSRPRARSSMRMRLIDVGERGATPIGEYTFNHSPW
jgi:hypothetical protein